MDIIEKEEIIALILLLTVVVGLDLTNHLTDQAVTAITWIGGAFMGSKGLKGFLPGNK
jgi:hypothetical protein